MDNRIKVVSFKTFEGRHKAHEQQVLDFIKKYPKYSKIIKSKQYQQ